MFEKLREVWNIPELRQKILLTLGMLGIYRIGFQVPLPITDAAAVEALKSQSGGLGDMLQAVAVLSASPLSQVTIFGLGIMPYISASIIFQLLGSVYPPLEQLQKEGEAGRKKINEYTRYATVVICVVQSWFWVNTFVVGQGLVDPSFLTEGGDLQFGWKVTSVLTMTSGTVFLMWLGEQIDEYGIGNGISLLIMAGILASMPGAGVTLLDSATIQLGGGGTKLGVENLVLLAFVFVAVIVGVVVYYARSTADTDAKCQARSGKAGLRWYATISAVKSQPGWRYAHHFCQQLTDVSADCRSADGSHSLVEEGGFFATFFGFLNDVYDRNSFLYNISYLVLIYFFCYFWTAITFNPKDMADNLKNFGSFIPGYRPGKRTADYLEKVMVRITYVGAGFLALVAIIPTLISSSLGVSFLVASFYGGTSLLIAVSVAFDLVQKIDSHLVMRNHQGLLE